MAPIIRIHPGQTELILRIVQTGCAGGQVCGKDTRLVIERPACADELLSKWKFEGCWPGYDVDAWNAQQEEVPALVYPAFDTNENGDTVFRLDDKLFSLPPGRYVGCVEWKNGVSITTIDIDLSPGGFLVESVSVTDQPCEGGC